MSASNTTTTTSFLPLSSDIVPGDTAWVLVSSALVLFMIPGLGFFYSGLSRHKNALSLIFLSLLSLAVVSIQWFLFGFSLSFSPTSSSVFLGNLDFACYMNVFEEGAVYPGVTSIPAASFVMFQGLFAAITPALAFGAAAERIRMVPCLVFLFLWSTFVYDFIAYWTWAPSGWIRKMGSLDYAGGTPVHIASGAAGLAYAIMIGKRHGFGKEDFEPHNLSTVFLGTAMLWFGWIGFNGGSELAANTRTLCAVINTNLSACLGGLTWVLLDFRRERKFSAFAFCSGVIAGMVAITPGAGLVPTWSCFIFGPVTASSCYLFITLKERIGFDDALDVFGVHGIGGIVGNILTGIFASSAIMRLNGYHDQEGGWLNGRFEQVGYQVAGTCAAFGWSFVGTYLILVGMDKVPYLKVRASIHEEVMYG